jgi:hypothetical protein
MRTSTILVLAQLTLLLSAKPARSDWLPILPGPIARVVAAGAYAAALREREVLILHEDGGLLSRMDARKEAGRPVNGPSAGQAAEETLDRLEIPEIERGTDYTDDLVEDESRVGQRRSWREATRSASLELAVLAPVLAASSTEIWVGNDRGIYRAGADGGLVQEFGREWLSSRMAAAGQWLLVDRGSTLALLSTGDVAPHLIPLSSPVSSIAISPSGARVGWAAGTEVGRVSPAGSSSFKTASPVRDLTFCGETLVALLADGLLAIPADGPGEMRAVPRGTRRLSCMAEATMPWLALGQGLWASSDQGRQWVALPAPEGPTLLDIAISDHHAWLATSDGLFASTDEPVPAELRPAKTSRLGRHAPPNRSWLAWLMPKVSLRAAAWFSPGEHRIEGFAYAAFPLGSQPAPAGNASGSRPDSAVEPARAEDAGSHDEDASCLLIARRKAVELAMIEPERARSYVSRAGHAAWLPELRVLVSRRYGRSESLDINGSSAALSSPLGIDTVNDIRYEARATWDLAKLVFSSEELAAQAQALRMAEFRRDIETAVNRLYFERRRLRIAPAVQDTTVRSQEVEAELDAMSAGAFGACLSEKSSGAR